MKKIKSIFILIIILMLLCSCKKENTIELGETIKTDFLKMSVEEVGWAEEIRPTDPDGVYSYLGDTENEKYFYIKGTIKNDCIEVGYTNNFTASVIFDGRYKYKTTSINYDYNGDLEYTIKPLTTSGYYICFSIPDELYETYKKCVIKIGFNEMLDSCASNVEDAKYIYELSMQK